MPRLPVACWIVALVAAPAFAQPQGLPPEQLKKIKAATVFVKVSLGDLGGSGSGFVVQATKDYGIVVTNHHVVEPPAPKNNGGRLPFPGFRPGMGGGGNAKPQIEVVFNSGVPTTEWTVKGEVIYENKADDIALLKVKALKSIPEPLSLTGADKLPETSTVYVCGFPFGEALAAGDKNPEISIGVASVSSNRTDADGNVVTVQLNGALNPGNSGGPVVTPEGKLVGVAVRTVTGAGIGFAVPPAMVRKAVGEILFATPTVSWLDGNPKKVRVEYRVTDASARFDNLTAWVAPANNAFAPPDDLSKAANVQNQPIAKSPDGTLFLVEFPVADGTFHWLQFAWTDEDGRKRRNKPQKISADSTRVEGGGPGAVQPRGGSREGPDPRQMQANGFDPFEEMRRYRGFQVAGDANVGKSFQYSMMVMAVNDEAARPGVKRLMVADRLGRPIREVKLYVPPAFGDQVVKAMLADGRAKVPAKVTFLAVKFERYATEAAATEVTFFDDGYQRPGWSAKTEPADLGVKVTPVAAPVIVEAPPVVPAAVEPRNNDQQPVAGNNTPPASGNDVRPPDDPNAKRPANAPAGTPAPEEGGTSTTMVVLFVVGVVVVLGLVGWGVTGFKLPGGGAKKTSRDRDRPRRSSSRRDDDEDDRPVPRARKASRDDDDEEERPVPRARRADREDDDRPRARRDRDDEDDRPRSRRRDDDDDDRPRPRRSRRDD